MIEFEFPAYAVAADVAPRTKPSVYPDPFAGRMAGRQKRALGDRFGLTSFGVNLTRLAPGAVSALHHAHTREDEFVYVLEGRPTLYTDAGPQQLEPGMCAGFKSGTGNAHHLANETDQPVLYIEVGARVRGDCATYPDDDLMAIKTSAGWQFSHKNGEPY